MVAKIPGQLGLNRVGLTSKCSRRKDVIKEGNYYRCCDSQPVQSDSYVEMGREEAVTLY